MFLFGAEFMRYGLLVIFWTIERTKLQCNLHSTLSTIGSIYTRCAYHTTSHYDIDLLNVVLENVVSIHIRMLSRRSFVEGIICSCSARRSGGMDCQRAVRQNCELLGYDICLNVERTTK